MDGRRIVLMTLCGGRIPHSAVLALIPALVVAVMLALLTGNDAVRDAALAVSGVAVVGIVVGSRVLPSDECADLKEALAASGVSAEASRVIRQASVAGALVVVAVIAFVIWAVATHRVSPYALVYAL